MKKLLTVFVISLCLLFCFTIINVNNAVCYDLENGIYEGNFPEPGQGQCPPDNLKYIRLYNTGGGTYLIHYVIFWDGYKARPYYYPGTIEIVVGSETCNMKKDNIMRCTGGEVTVDFEPYINNLDPCNALITNVGDSGNSDFLSDTRFERKHSTSYSCYDYDPDDGYNDCGTAAIAIMGPSGCYDCDIGSVNVEFTKVAE